MGMLRRSPYSVLCTFFEKTLIFLNLLFIISIKAKQNEPLSTTHTLALHPQPFIATSNILHFLSPFALLCTVGIEMTDMPLIHVDNFGIWNFHENWSEILKVLHFLRCSSSNLFVRFSKIFVTAILNFQNTLLQWERWRREREREITIAIFHRRKII